MPRPWRSAKSIVAKCGTRARSYLCFYCAAISLRNTPSNSDRSLLEQRLDVHLIGVLPQQIEAIALAILCGEKVHHHIKCVHHGPTAALRCIDSEDFCLLGVDNLLELHAQRPQVRFGRDRRENEVIGDARQLAHME